MGRRGRSKVFKDEKMCDACGKKGLKKCGRCECAVYCSVECQRDDWRHHKPECKLLKLCQEAPQVDANLASMRKSPTQIGVVHTVKHGHYFFVMERKEWYHTTESDREVILASTKDLSFLGLITCLAESILHPAYDNDLAGPRRPDSVCLHSASLGDDRLMARLASVIYRLGISIVNLDGSEQNTWCSHWFCVQQGWLGELSDARFLDSIPPRRRIPQTPNGQARRNQISHTVSPRLKPTDFPTRAEVLSLPFEQARNTRGLWIVCRGSRLFICYHGQDGFSLRFDTRVALQPNRRPFASDVILCIYKVLVADLRVRPVGAWLGQPSICSHNDVELYEKELDGSVLRGNLTLGAMNSMEGQLEGMLPHFREAGVFDDDESN